LEDPILPPVITRAEPMQRIAAALIDAFIISICSFILYIFPYGHYMAYTLQMVYWLTRDALPFLDGKSIGKKLIGLRVVRDHDFTPITDDYGASLIRMVTLFIPLFQIIDALMIFSQDRKRFGDRWAKTIVIIDKN
jgi:uncharacterized RDD family membrane protein YckC